MVQKPKLTKSISFDTFKNHYWLKTELILFCKDNGLVTVGSKQEIAHRIESFITTGSKMKPARGCSTKDRDSDQPITYDTLVINYKNDAATRQFFVDHIGQHFHFDAYLRQFTKKNNITKGLSYGDLINGWLIEESKRDAPNYKSNIGEQFEYNQFIRDFFANEKDKSRLDAIIAWKFIKTVAGNKTYAHYKSIMRTEMK